jgi:hypothetical protein
LKVEKLQRKSTSQPSSSKGTAASKPNSPYYVVGFLLLCRGILGIVGQNLSGIRTD